jgi:hypothetical protein
MNTDTAAQIMALADTYAATYHAHHAAVVAFANDEAGYERIPELAATMTSARNRLAAAVLGA